MTDQAAPPRPSSALLAAVPAVVGVLVAFVVAIVQYAGVDDGTTKHLYGVDSFLGLPNVGVSVIFFSLFVAWFVGAGGGALYRHGLYVAAIVVASLGAIYELVVTIFNFSWVSVVLLIAAVVTLIFTILGCRATVAAGVQPQVARADRPTVFGLVLVVAGLGGLAAAYNLSVDKITAVLSPSTHLNCSFSILVSCGDNLKSWQGALFGFPNPLIGLGGFAVTLLVGIAILAGVKYPRWWMIAFNIGVIGAFVFITFLIYSSVFVIGTLCVWCALVWIVTIPSFWLTTLGNLSNGTYAVNARTRQFWKSAYTWTPLLTLLCYVVIFLLFQLQLNLLGRL
ncbi:MAG TPA: vitamin K epoxide reductase family protein [Galbitalea sp.]|nr:vitamin K epoxide reductase family protein [Galbitalea sp.]